MTAIFKREFKAYFKSPIGYVILAVYLLFLGLSFTTMYVSGYPYTSYIFSQMFAIVLFSVPIITMRLMSEDKRQKTDQALLTAPVSLSSIVMGKFLAAFAFFSLIFVETFIFQLIFLSYGTVDWPSYFGNVVGLALFAAALIAVGLFVSSLTESQVIAAICSFAISLALMMLDSIASMTNVAFINDIAKWVSFSGRYQTFTEGIFDFANVMFFVSFTALFLFFTVRVLEKKRYS